MRSTRQQARFAGFLYLFMCITGLPGLILIPARLTVRGDAAATAEGLRAHATLWRAAIASELFHQVVFLFLAFALFDLFERVNRRLAVQLVVLVAISIPIVFLNVLGEIAALTLAGGAPFLSGITPPERDSLAYLALRLHGEGYGIVWVFWSLWLVPFGLLAWRSGFLPKALGVLLLVAATGDMMRAVTTIFPAVSGALDPVPGVLGLGELPIIFWLAIAGAKETLATPAAVPHPAPISS